MRGLLAVIGSAIGWMVFVGFYWVLHNNIHRVNGVGWLARQGWPLGDVWTCVTVAGFLGALAGIGRLIARRRRSAAAARVAEEMGFSSTADVPVGELKPFESLPVLKRRGWAGNLMTSRGDGQSVSVLDVTTIVGSGRGARSYNRTVALLPSASEGLPDFELRPRSFVVQLKAGFGMEGVTFTQEGLAPAVAEVVREFGRHYHLSSGSELFAAQMGWSTSEDDEAIRRAFPLEVLAYFAANPGWRVQSAGGNLALWRGDQFCPASDRQRLLTGALEAAHALRRGSDPEVASPVMAGPPQDEAVARQVVGLVLGAFLGFVAGVWVFLAVAMGLGFPAPPEPGVRIWIQRFLLGCPLIGLVLGALLGRFLLTPVLARLARGRRRVTPPRAPSPSAPDPRPES